ncbi:DoxX family protein [Pedobacter yulinensis]|uniref:DoxX family protein n=1 Tax=Pedobacter yulinensis TaxID=2126353 RepID=A0A2T3HQA6_9SPHI|nr:BT_3928 family protein [Pedobacter yulinensis]PST84628.1 DoxX family protein [Pedobacter yulinensis]
MKRNLLLFARLFVGILFIFSGLIKANDPLGFGYKLQEYFDVFHMGFLNGIATLLAILLCALEILLGALLLLGMSARRVAWGLLLLIIFFTLLTFVSAAFKVVTSCGCFGDAIPLTPWQSFTKDLVLLLLIVFIFRERNRITPVVHHPGRRAGLFAAIFTASLMFGSLTYNYGPVIDFLPYKVGANIPALMQVPPGKKPDEYRIVYQLKNSKTGQSRQITDAAYLKEGIWKDDAWKIVGEPTKELWKKGFTPPVKDLFINDASGTDYTRELLENPYYNLVVVAWNLDQANEQAIAAINALALNASEHFNIRTVLLTASSARDAATFSRNHRLFMEVFYADAVPLKSMVRANPGVLLLREGTIVNKWHYHSLPDFDILSKNYFSK